jgi:hypothetical protein
MQKLIFIILLSSFLLNSSKAQVKVVQTKPKLIPTLGIGSAFILGSPSWNDPVGAQCGLEASFFRFKKNFSLVGGVNGTLQGAKYTDFGIHGVVRLIYIKIPCVVRGQSKSGFFGEIGVEPGFLISAKDKYGGESHEYKDYMNVFDFGIPIGFGKEFKNGIGIGLRTIPGLTNISKGSSTKDRNLLILIRATYTVGGNE